MFEDFALYIYAIKLAKSLVVLVVGYLASKGISSFSGSVIGKEFGGHLGRVSKKLVFYLLMGITVLTVVGDFIDLTALIAAAGVIGVAIGFAAQKSMSNLISGFFLMVDQPFEINDVIEVDGQRGFVMDIGLFSTRIRTLDNKYLRIPNDTLANANIVNYTRYDIRRLDLPIGIAYKEDLGKAVELVETTVKANEFVLMEPGPLVLVTSYGDSSMNLEIRAWVLRKDFFNARKSLIIDTKKALDEAGIEIPFPHRTIYFGDKPEFQISKKDGK